MKKDFSAWHKKKTEIDHIEKRVFFHEREVWWCSVGLNIGFEQDGKGEDFARPILILKVFNREVFIGVPLTTRPKEGKFYSNIDLGDKKARKVILSQFRLFDAKRLQEKIITISSPVFCEIKEKIIRLLK